MNAAITANTWPLAFPEDRSPWGKSFTTSVTVHAILLLLLSLTMSRVKPELVLTEVTLVETNPVKMPAKVSVQAPIPSPVKVPGSAGPLKGPMQKPGAGGGIGAGPAKSGYGAGIKPGKGVPFPLSRVPIKATPGSGTSNLPNELPVSSPVGTPKGIALTPVVPSAPIASLPSDLGYVGNKKVQLAPLAGRVGPAGSGSGPGGLGGASSSGRQVPGLVGVGDGKANLNVDARRPMGGGKGDVELGVPIVAAGGGGGGGGYGYGTGSGAAGSGSGSGSGILGGGGKGGSYGLMGNPKAKPGLEKLMNNPQIPDSWGNKGGPFSIEGPLKYRKILKKEMPIYPRWAEEKGIVASVSIRIWANPTGKVKENMYLEKTSGYPELDKLAKEAIAKFLFIALPKDQTQEDEWGIATFRFELKE